MMTTPPEKNVHALAIEGTFDDCQSIVKGMFSHHAFCEEVRLSGVNSINWARIIAQVVYYFTSAVALGSPLRKVAFTVPTGNFGNIYAGYVALRMGLPVDRLVIATNINDILTRTVATGSYDLREVRPPFANCVSSVDAGIRPDERKNWLTAIHISRDTVPMNHIPAVGGPGCDSSDRRIQEREVGGRHDGEEREQSAHGASQVPQCRGRVGAVVPCAGREMVEDGGARLARELGRFLADALQDGRRP